MALRLAFQRQLANSTGACRVTPAVRRWYSDKPAEEVAEAKKPRGRPRKTAAAEPAAEATAEVVAEATPAAEVAPAAEAAPAPKAAPKAPFEPKEDPTKYNATEYLNHDKLSYYDIDNAMRSHRLPQPKP
eukprot:Colp12_sorted_trinity150504_noHs@10725